LPRDIDKNYRIQPNEDQIPIFSSSRYFPVEGENTMTKRVDICRLKKIAFTELPRDSILREILLCEHDELDMFEFVAPLSDLPATTRGAKIALLAKSRVFI